METLWTIVEFCMFAAVMSIPVTVVATGVAWIGYGLYLETTMTEAARKAREEEYQARHERTEALVYGLADLAGRSIRHQMLKAERHVRHLERDVNRVA